MHALLHRGQRFGVVRLLQRGVDEVGDFHHFLLLHAARGHGRGADADAAGFHDRLGVEGDGVFVHRDPGVVERLLGLLAVEAFGAEVDQEHMVVGAAGNNAVAEHGEAGGQGAGVGHDLRGVGFERRLQRLVEADSFGRDDVHERAALHTGENLRVDFFGILRFAQNDTGARTTQALVRRAGDEIRIRHRARVRPAGHEPGNVRHVDKEQRSDLIGNAAHALEVDKAGISGGAGRDHFRTALARELGQGIVVDRLAPGADPVMHGIVELAGKVRFVTVREVSAVGQIHGQDAVADIERGEVDGRVGLAAAVGLHIGVLGAEKLLGPLDGQCLHDIDVLAAAIPTAPGITFRVFVGQGRTLRLAHRTAGEIFRGDQLDVLELPALFVVDGRGDGGIGSFDGAKVGQFECGRTFGDGSRIHG